jgi:hypothetical protein
VFLNFRQNPGGNAIFRQGQHDKSLFIVHIFQGYRKFPVPPRLGGEFLPPHGGRGQTSPLTYSTAFPLHSGRNSEGERCIYHSACRLENGVR